MTENVSVPLLDHILALMREKDLRDQQRFDAQSTATEAALAAVEEGNKAALAASEKAVQKAEAASEKRFDAVNEFRAALADQTSTFVPRTEFNALKERMDRGEGKSAGSGDVLRFLPTIVGVLIAAAGLAVAIFT